MKFVHKSPFPMDTNIPHLRQLTHQSFLPLIPQVNHTAMNYKIVTSGSAEQLSAKVNELIKDVGKPVGSHQALVTHQQNRFSGDQHKDTVYDVEYSQTMIKD